MRGIDPTGFYEWKNRFQTQGQEVQKDLQPIHNPPAGDVGVDGRVDHGAGECPITASAATASRRCRRGR